MFSLVDKETRAARDHGVNVKPKKTQLVAIHENHVHESVADGLVCIINKIFFTATHNPNLGEEVN